MRSGGVLDAAEDAFDDVMHYVEVGVVGGRILGNSLSRDDTERTLLSNGLSDYSTVKVFVRSYGEWPLAMDE